tara:strand:- start:230 stop:496 length:267 start_codon:yes stop_codon:yes gene_type:complete
LIYKVQVEFSKDILEGNDDQINIEIKNKPIKGKANKEIIRKVAKYFSTSTGMMQIRSQDQRKNNKNIIRDNHVFCLNRVTKIKNYVRK